MAKSAYQIDHRTALKHKKRASQTAIVVSLPPTPKPLYSWWIVFDLTRSLSIPTALWPHTHTKPTCAAWARAWPTLREAVFLCLEGKDLVMEPTIERVLSYHLSKEAQNLSQKTSPSFTCPGGYFWLGVTRRMEFKMNILSLCQRISPICFFCPKVFPTLK